jgi:drug/metabolite transporter (DMT)-like permease
MARFAPILACLAAALLFGAATPFSKSLLAQIGPVTLAGLLYLGAALGVAPLALRRGSAPTAPSRANLLRLGVALLCGGILAPVFFLYGLQRSPAGSVALWLNLEVVATTLLAGLLFREHLGARVLFACGVVAAGGALLALPLKGGTLSGAPWVALACLCWGLDNNATAMIDGFTPSQVTFTKGLAAGAVNLAAGLSLEGRIAGWDSVIFPLALGAISYGLSLVFYIGAAQRLGAARSQMLFAMSPFWGLLLSWWMLGESVSATQLAAGGAMAAGIAIMLAARHGHAHRHGAGEHTHAHRHDDTHHLHVHESLPDSVQHTHAHAHEPLAHEHPHEPDLHHRHEH